MSQHTPLGDLSLPIGHYLKDGDKKLRRRNLGTLMQTTDDGGERRFWIKLNADALNPSLLILCSRNGILEGGADGVIVNVYAREERKPGAAAPADSAAPADGPF